MSWNHLFAWTFVVWIAYGMVFLYPRKRRLFDRLGWDKTSDDLIRIGKQGDDIEASKFLRDSRRYLVVGLVIGFLLLLSRYA